MTRPTAAQSKVAALTRARPVPVPALPADTTSAELIEWQPPEPADPGDRPDPPEIQTVDGRTDEEHLAHLIEAFEKWRGHTAPDDPDRVYPSVDWHELWQRAGKPVDWLLEPLLIAGRITALYSPAKAGKSLLSLEVTAALAAGRPVLGQPAREPIDVLYVDLENSEDDLFERLVDLGYQPGDLSRLHYKSFPGLPALDSATGGEHLLALAQHHNAQLVVIDTVSRVIDGPENEADTFRALYRHALMPLKAEGRAVLRLDHTGKDSTKGQRGSSSKVDDVDAVWRLTARASGAVDLTCTHRRHNHGAELLQLVRLTAPLRHAPAHISSVIAADVQHVLDILDRLQVPIDYGRERARKAMSEAGESCGNDLLNEAISTRKRLAHLSTDRSDADEAQMTLEEEPDSERTDQ